MDTKDQAILLHDDQRPGEVSVPMTGQPDAGLHFIGRIQTPWTKRGECPRRGDLEGPICKIHLFEPWRPGLLGLSRHTHLQILYWMDRARRDLIIQTPRTISEPFGAFSLRSPIRPNPIASSLVAIVEILPDGILVRGLDCLDGTPLLDIKPEACPGAVTPAD